MCVVASGSIVGRCLQATAGADGVLVVAVDRVKPFPTAEVRAALSMCRAVVCAEEHGKVGGLASALLESELIGSRTFVHVAIPGFTETGSQIALIQKYGLDPRGLSRALQQAAGAGA